MSRTWALSLLLLLPGLAPAQSLEPAKADAIDRVLSAYTEKHAIPGLSAALALEGKVVWSKAYGVADIESSASARPDTVYRIGSIDEGITATAALHLVEQRALDLDLPIQRYCPSFPEKPWILTSRQLLSHTAGIRDDAGAGNAETLSVIHYETLTEALAPFKSEPLLFEPGTESAHSSHGFVVLACVMEGAAHVPFWDVMTRQVLSPAGMTHSHRDDPSTIVPNRAAGYVRLNGELQNAPHVDRSDRLPVGGYLTTAPDLAAFAARFMDCHLVSCGNRDAMLTAQPLMGGAPSPYGLGFQSVEAATGAVFEGGSSPGASAMLYMVPKQRLAVVLLSNLEAAPEQRETVLAISRIAAADAVP
jgi:CubicO group peptidase (beta-lactamase class C family)